MMIVDYTGVVTNKITYDAYGAITASATTLRNSYEFTGLPRDAKSGLSDAYARHYRPGLGRFITQDTHRGNPREPWTQNLYAYVGNNPINYVDPTGHSAESGSETMDSNEGGALPGPDDGNSISDLASRACYAVLSDCGQFLEFLSLYTGTPEWAAAVESVGTARATNDLLRAAVAESQPAVAAESDWAHPAGMLRYSLRHIAPQASN